MYRILSLFLTATVLSTSLSALELNPEKLEFGKLRFSIPFSELSGTSDIFSEGIILNDGDVMEILNYTASRFTITTTNGTYYDDKGFITVYTRDSGANYEKAIYHRSGPTLASVTSELIGSHIVGPTTVYVGTQHEGSETYTWYNGASGELSITLHYAIQRKRTVNPQPVSQ